MALKADAFLTEVEAGSDKRLHRTVKDAQRLRLMLESHTAWVRRWAGSLSTPTRSWSWGSQPAGPTCWHTRGRRSTSGSRVRR